MLVTEHAHRRTRSAAGSSSAPRCRGRASCSHSGGAGVLRLRARAGAQPVLRRLGYARLRAVRAGRSRLAQKLIARRGRADADPPHAAARCSAGACGATGATEATSGADFAVERSPAAALVIRERINPRPQALLAVRRRACRPRCRPALAPLGFAITWIDGRAGQFPEPPPAGVKMPGARHAGACRRRGAARHGLRS